METEKQMGRSKTPWRSSRFTAEPDFKAPPQGPHSWVLIGGLTRNRVCFDHVGRKMKVLDVSLGSVRISRAGQPRRIGEKVIRSREKLTISPQSVVYLTDPTQEVR